MYSVVLMAALTTGSAATEHHGYRGGCYGGLALRDQILLPEKPLDLPRTQREADQQHRQGEHGWPQQWPKIRHLRRCERKQGFKREAARPGDGDDIAAR